MIKQPWKLLPRREANPSKIAGIVHIAGNAAYGEQSKQPQLAVCW
jgi:hypothetical protein